MSYALYSLPYAFQPPSFIAFQPNTPIQRFNDLTNRPFNKSTNQRFDNFANLEILGRPKSRLKTVVDIYFSVDIVYVGFNGMAADEEFAGNSFVAEPGGH